MTLNITPRQRDILLQLVDAVQILIQGRDIETYHDIKLFNADDYDRDYETIYLDDMDAGAVTGLFQLLKKDVQPVSNTETVDFLDALNELEIKADENWFIATFGDDMGRHLWRTKYTPFGNSMMRLYSYLDRENSLLLAEAVTNEAKNQRGDN